MRSERASSNAPSERVVKDLRHEASDLKEGVADLTLKNRLLKARNHLTPFDTRSQRFGGYGRQMVAGGQKNG